MNEDPDQIDRLLELLANEERRQVLRYFDRNETDSASLEELTARLAGLRVEAGGSANAPTTEARARLHHVHLPKLREFGVVEYDARAGDVRYHPDEQVEALASFLVDA